LDYRLKKCKPCKLEFSWKENSSVPVGWSLRKFVYSLRVLRWLLYRVVQRKASR